MMQCAAQDIAQARVTPGVQWLVAVFHHPPYTKGTHDSDYEIELVEMRESYLPVLVSDLPVALLAACVAQCLHAPLIHPALLRSILL